MNKATVTGITVSDIIYSFPFSADRSSEVLILGSMPGVESLRQRQYYAHPRNLFWDFMAEMFDIPRQLPYRQRLKKLRSCGVALWDVAYTCKRNGSLDSNISDVKANDFEFLFSTAPQIHTIFFNGQKAAQLYNRQISSDRLRELKKITLPSTSPANASIPYTKKQTAWRQVLTALGK